jgi:hypothetical protein
MNPKPLLLLNHFTVPLFFLPTTTAAAPPGAAAAAAASSAIPQPRWTKTSTGERRASPPVHPPLFLPQNPNSAASVLPVTIFFYKNALTLSCSYFLRTPSCLSEFEKTDTAAERGNTEREEQMRMVVVGRRHETQEERDKREREGVRGAGGISKGAKALLLTHCDCGATKAMAAAAAAG